MLSLRSPPWRRNPSKPASGKPGAVQAEAAALLVLRKNAAAIWGDGEDA